MSHALQSLTVFATVFAALFPVMNPLGGAPIFLSLSQHCSHDVRARLARSIAVNSFLLLFSSLLVGDAILNFFGVTMPVLKLAGGTVVAVMGWNLLNQDPNAPSATDSTALTDETASGSAFYPLTMPLVAGPGAIATMISLAANYKDSPDLDFQGELYIIVGCALALFAMSVCIYVCFVEAERIQKLLGKNGTNVLLKLLGFMLLAIGVQIMWGGLQAMISSLLAAMPANQ